MQKAKIISAFAILSILFGCGPSAEQKAEQVLLDNASNAYISSSAAVENSNDTTHRFIRSANLKFKVKSVISSTYYIEDITGKLGGFVTYTKLESTIDNVEHKSISADSSLITTRYTVSNTIIIRVPNTKLDTALRMVTANMEFLDYRIIRADDVALRILSNTLAQKRSTSTGKRIGKAIDNQGKKLGETVNAESVLTDTKEQADNAWLDNLALTEQINFSTVNIEIYQRQTVKRELIANEKNIDEYEPGFGQKVADSLKFGWDILEAFILILVKLWGLLLFGLLVLILIKYIIPQLRKH
jgi:hypothetical protein